jgi:hypothetical protein
MLSEIWRMEDDSKSSDIQSNLLAFNAHAHFQPPSVSGEQTHQRFESFCWIYICG